MVTKVTVVAVSLDGLREQVASTRPDERRRLYQELVEQYPEPLCEMHPVLAERLGVSDGDLVTEPLFEGYQVVGKLGAGPATDTYRALQQPLGRPVLIKSLSASILPSSPFAATLERTLDAFADRQRWRSIQQRGMQRDFGWSRSAIAYESLYEQACSGKTQEQRPGDEQQEARAAPA